MIPAFREASALPSTLMPVLRLGYSVVVVDDGSDDDTWELLQRLPVHALRHPVNLGQGAALQTGMSYALSRGADCVVHFDADGQHLPEQIADLLAPIIRGEADVAFGSRFLRASDTRRVPPAKRFALSIAVLVSGLMSGLWLRDAHNGFRALSRKAVEKINLKENGYAHATEILTQVRRTGLRHVEVPVTVLYSEYSTAKGQPLINGINIVLDLVLARLFR